MKAIKYFLVLLFGLTIVVSGCSQEAEKSKEDADKPKTADTKAVDNEEVKKDQEKEEPKEELVVDPLPSTYEELEALPQGQYHELYFNLNEEEKEKVIETFKDLPDVSNNPSEKELDHFYMELMKMVQKDYKGPEEAIKRLKFQAIGSPEMKDTRYQFKENLNVEKFEHQSSSGEVEIKIGRAHV